MKEQNPASPGDVVAYLRDRHPHHEELSRVRLLRMAYLVDWKSAVERRRQMTDLAWGFGEEGPYCSGAGRAVHLELSGAGRGHEGYPSLTAEDEGLLNFVVRSVEGKGYAELEKLAYSTYPIATYPERGSMLDLVGLAREYGRVKLTLTPAEPSG